MNNLERYNQVFCKLFSLSEDFEKDAVRLNGVDDWDSVGHMELITVLEDEFDIMFETEDILALDSYNQGIEIIKKYGIVI